MTDRIEMQGFDPFAPVNAKYGAPMGRHGWGSYDPTMGPLHVMGGEGEEGYDAGGAYWGQYVFAAWAGKGEVEYLAYLEPDQLRAHEAYAGRHEHSNPSRAC